MPYSKYLKSGQKIMLRALSPAAERFDALTVFLHEQGPDHLDLALPYQLRDGENYPFAPEMAFEILSDAMGVGIRLTGHFYGARGSNQVRICHNRDLQLIRRRGFLRREALIGLRYSKGRGTLRSFREQWEKNTRILNQGSNLAKLPEFPRCPVNISGSGIRFGINLPAAIADLCLLLLELPDGKPPVCILAEIVWLAERVEGDRCQAGMQFIQVLEADRKRVNQFILSAASDREEKTAPRVVGRT